MPLTNILKSLRARNGITQEQMAKMIGISKNTYNRKELCLREFTLLEAKNISDIFNCSIEYIFFDSQCNTKDTNFKNLL